VPADKYLSAAQLQIGIRARTRSMAMNSFLGLRLPELRKELLYGSKQWLLDLSQWLKLNEIRRPASIFVTIDEHPDTINDGLFINNPDWRSATRWTDLPASYHAGGAGFSFADGHAEIHKWKSSATKLPVLFVEMPERASACPRLMRTHAETIIGWWTGSCADTRVLGDG